MNRRFCYWTVATGDYVSMARTMVASARRVGVTEDIHVWCDETVEGATCHELGQPLSGRHFRFTFLRDRVRKLSYDYFIWLDADSFFVRHPADPLRALRGAPLHVVLESNLASAGNRAKSWWDCPNERLIEMMSAAGVRSRAVYNVDGGMFIVHRDFVETLLTLTKSFYAYCKQNGHAFGSGPLLAYAMHMICGDTERHTLANHHDLWCSDWAGVFRDRLPDGNAWEFRGPFTDKPLKVNPAVIHVMRSRELLVKCADPAGSNLLSR